VRNHSVWRMAESTLSNLKTCRIDFSKRWKEKAPRHGNDLMGRSNGQRGDKSLRRPRASSSASMVARLGNGWFGAKLNPEQAAAKVATLRSLMTEAGRDISEREIELTGPIRVTFAVARS
jgi:alkanesulfonate monooxygenase SsuD/methylene tetrahydromethanopterin reductase-like flavin-dependent oxidoreductase (luciferase family)